MGGFFGGGGNDRIQGMGAAERNRYADLAVSQMSSRAYSSTGMADLEGAGDKMIKKVTADQRDDLAVTGLEMLDNMSKKDRAKAMKAASEDSYEIRVTGKDHAHQQDIERMRTMARKHGH